MTAVKLFKVFSNIIRFCHRVEFQPNSLSMPVEPAAIEKFGTISKEVVNPVVHTIDREISLFPT